MLPAKLEAKYELLGKLGVGGTAVVYQIQDKTTRKKYALKLKSESVENTDIDFQQLAQREFDLIHKLHYPGIVSIHEISKKDSEYILLDYCSGQTLDKLGKIENSAKALNIISSLAINLEYIHAHDIIHADLKPENIFLPADESICETHQLFYTKLFDFSLGLNRTEPKESRVGIGTIGYMAPEIIDTNHVSVKSDLFALGVIAYQILSGHHPFITDDTDPVLINSKIKEEEHAPLSNFRTDVPDQLILLIDSLLEKDENKRPRSAWEVCDILKNVGASYPYKRALHPKYFVKRQTENLSFDIMNVDESKAAELQQKYDLYIKFRLFLTNNFIRNNLYYSENKFSFRNKPIMPINLLRQEFKHFGSKSFQQKKEIITSAIIDDNEFSEKQNLCISNSKILVETLPYFVSTSTVKTIASHYAPLAKQSEYYQAAARLYTQSGDLIQAEDCTFQAVAILRNDNNTNDALSLLNYVIDYASLKSEPFTVRSLIKLKGDILKDIGETEKTEATYKKLIELFKDQKNDKLLAETYKNLGDLYKVRQIPQEGIIALKKALAIYQEIGDELEISHTYNNLGTNYWIDNDYQNSFLYYRKALRIQRKLHAQKETASTLNNIAILHTIKGRHQRAIKIFDICIKIQKEIGIKSELARTLNNVGYSYLILSKYDKSVEYTLESLKYFKEIGAQKEVLINLENLTSVMFITNQLNEAIRYLKEGIEISNNLGDKLQIGIFKVFLSSIFVKMGRLQDADTAFREVDEILEYQDDIYLKIIYYLEKTNVLIELNNISQANEHIKTLYQLSEKLQDKTMLVRIKLLESKFMSSEDIYATNSALIDELKLIREQYLNQHNYLIYCLQHDMIGKATDLINDLESKSELIENDIEGSSIYNTIGEYYLHTNDLDKAAYYITRSNKIAQSSKLEFDKLRSRIIEGRIKSKLNDHESCYRLYRSALESAKTVSMQIQDEDTRQLFQQSNEIQFLIKEIKELSSLLSHKKEQVN